ncbi:MAG TPA: hypothetical protein VFJ24_07700, partial [Gaiellales bacterium]|nr:hypothetical protein [Gaiellales bacterium]
MTPRVLGAALAVVGTVQLVTSAPAVGRVWQITPTPSPAGEGSCLAGVSGDAGGVWAVGSQGSPVTAARAP